MAGLLDVMKNLRLPKNFVPDMPAQENIPMQPNQQDFVLLNIPGMGEVKVPKSFMYDMGKASLPFSRALPNPIVENNTPPQEVAKVEMAPQAPEIAQLSDGPQNVPQDVSQSSTGGITGASHAMASMATVTPPGAPSPAPGGFMGFLNSDQGKGLLNGLGAAMSAKAANRHSTMTPEFLQGMNQYKQKSALSDLGSKLEGMNISPEQKAVLSYAVQSQDPKLLDSVTKSIFSGGNSSLSQQRMNVNKWSTLSVAQRQALVAQAAGMGIPPDKANSMFIDGKSLDEMAKDQGLDANNLPEPIFPTTTGSLTKIQRRQQALAEMDSLGKKIAKWTAPYARRWHGWSGEALSDAVHGKNIEQLSDFLAAKGLALEQAAIRTNALGGQVGEGVLHSMVDSSMGHIEFPTSLVNSELYRKTQEKIDSAIHESVQRANKVGLSPRLANEENMPQEEGSPPAAQQPQGKLTEADIDFNMKTYGKSRAEVLAAAKAKGYA